MVHIGSAREFAGGQCSAAQAAPWGQATVSRNDIHLALYNSEHDDIDRSIDTYISRIRKKLGDGPVTPKYLKTVRGSGGVSFIYALSID